MTNRHTKNARVLRRIGAAVAATIVVSTAAASGSQASTTPSTPKAGGDIKVAIFDTFPGFCVANNPANSSLMATRTMFEGLVEKTRGGDFIGLLAKSWTKSPDLKTWTFQIREGIKFHDGSDLTADVVVANYNYSSGRAFAAVAARSGAVAARTAVGYTLGTSVSFQSNIASIAKDGTNGVKFVLDRAQNDFPGTIYASGRGFIRGLAQLTDGTKCSNTAVGTGPFKMVSWDMNNLTVEKNANYWRKDPARPAANLPYLDKIAFTNVKEASQRAAAIRRGTYEAGMFSGATDGTFIRDLRQRKSVVTEIKSPAEYYPSLWLNQTRVGSPFSSRNARLAVISCIDRVSFAKVRTRGEGVVPKSIVGPNNPMYTTKGFTKFSVAASKKHLAAWRAEPGNEGKTLSFAIPADTSGASQANIKFLQSQWKKCGITANMVVEETAVIIQKSFNSSVAGGAQMGYDALSLLLFEGTDVSFNSPFVVTNAFPANSVNPVAAAFRTSLGTLLSLNHHTDTKVDELLYAGQAAPTKAAAKAKMSAATAYLQTNGFMTSIQHQYYTMFYGKKLAGIGTLQIEKGKSQRLMTNWGIDWTGVYKK
jgi:peptide/nickel transport system substrate-binding protein